MASTRKCKQCGALMAAHVKHCTKCGARMACCSSCQHDQDAGRMAPTATCDACVVPAGLAGCSPLPFSYDAVDKATERILGAGIDDDDAVILRVLLSVYSTTPEGVAIPWARLGPSDPSCLCALARRVAARVRLVIASAAELAADSLWASLGGESIGGDQG